MPVDGIRSWRSSSLRIEPGRRYGTDLYGVIAPLGTSRWSIYTSGEIPRLGEAHPDDPGVVCAGVDIRSGNGPTEWSASITYRTLSPEFPGTDPTLAPPRHRWSELLDQREVDTDRDDVPYRNSADEPLQPAHVRPFAVDVLEYEFNAPVSVVDIDWLRSYRQTVNSDDQTGTWPSGDRKIGAAIGEALIESIRADYVEAQDTLPHYYRVSMRILIGTNKAVSGSDPTDNAWRPRILDQGYRTKSGSVYSTVVDGAGLPLNQPILLDGAGQPSATPVWLWFRDFDTVAFAPLAIALPAA